MRSPTAAIAAALAALAVPMPSTRNATIPDPNRPRPTRRRHGGKQETAVNPKRRERKRLMLLHGITTGRQWVRLRRQLKLDI